MENSAILSFGEPSLHQPSVEVDFNDPALPAEIQKLKTALTEFQAKFGWGRAMAAPQIGINKRIIATYIDDTFQILINPEITYRSAEKMVVWDDCMSLPFIAAEVERHCSIDVVYRDEKRTTCTLKNLSPNMSELLQHEIDHLDGIVMTDRLISGGAIIKRELVEKFEPKR